MVRVHKIMQSDGCDTKDGVVGFCILYGWKVAIGIDF